MAQEYPEYVLICLDAALLHEVYVARTLVINQPSKLLLVAIYKPT